jgi:polyhydroxyalkanoate synthesis regulator phasin
MVKSGEVRRDQASGLVKTALDFSKANRVEFIEAIRAEIAKQVARAGFVSKRDVERLERRVARLEGSAKKTTSRAKKTSGKKPASKRSPAKTAGRKSTAQAPGTGPAETGSDTGFGPPATPDPPA